MWTRGPCPILRAELIPQKHVVYSLLLNLLGEPSGARRGIARCGRSTAELEGNAHQDRGEATVEEHVDESSKVHISCINTYIYIYTYVTYI